jgi:hypothetical protein
MAMPAQAPTTSSRHIWLPTRNQVDSASRHAISIAGTAIAIFGLQAKGVSLDQVKAVIAALGSSVNDLVVLIAALAPLYAAIKAAHTASPTQQAIAVADTGAKVITTPEIAAATPDQPNITSVTQTKVVAK